MDSWKLYVPSDCHSIIKCHNVLKRFARGCFPPEADIVACANTGYLLEFKRKCIIATCELSDSDAESVRPFISYNPVKLFYVVKFPNKIVIVLREEKLKVFKTFENIFKYEIRDFESIGTPQLGIWTKDDPLKTHPSMITDFSEEFSQSTKETTSGAQNEMIQEFTVHVQEVNLKLEEKRNLRISSIYSLFNKEQEVSKNVQNLVPLFGKGNMTQQSEKKPLSRTSAWQKIHNGKWVLGVNVSNAGKGSVSDVALLLKCPQDKKLRYSSVTMACGLEEREATKKYVPTPGLSKWKTIEAMAEGSTACVIGILEKPIFSLEHVFTISGVITYKTESSSSVGFQLAVPEFTLNALDSISVRLAPFCDAPLPVEGSEKPCDASGTEADFLAVVASSEHVRLLAEKAGENFQTVLQDRLKFKRINAFGAFYHKGEEKPGLGGILIRWNQTSPEDYELDVFAKDRPQVFLLVHCMCALLPTRTSFSLSPHRKRVSPWDVWKALHEEVDFFVGQVAEWSAGRSPDDDVVPVPPGEYRAFLRKLSQLEAETDEVFALANGS